MPPKAKKAQSEYVSFVIEQMSFVHRLRVRGMFGGYGIFQDDCMFALIIEDQLYFKADTMTRAEFEAKGLSPFTYTARGKLVEVNYFEAPPEVFDEMDEMQNWVHKALTVAMKAKKSK
ncbi:MAG: TfoX/Sxy family protein [Methylotenera sp.]|nr:TfoX/Sxy family protein [Methylotenera sp.]